MIPIKNRFLIYKNEKNNKSKNCKKIKIIHFNDVYNIEGGEAEPVGGASRFSTALKCLQKEEKSLVIFSGDAFSPSKSK